MNTTSPPPAAARISIIGAGPGGLTCARILQRHGIDVTVHDRDRAAPATRAAPSTCTPTTARSPCARPACSRSSSHAARPEGQEMRQMDITGRFAPITSRRPTNSSSPRSTAASCGTCCSTRWSREPCAGGTLWSSVERTRRGDARPALRRRHDHRDRPGHRRRRRLLPGTPGRVSAAVPQYTGVSFLEAWFDDVENRHPELAELVGQGGAHAGRR